MDLFNFINTYNKLSEDFFAIAAPDSAECEPSLVLWNDALADELGLPDSLSDEDKAAFLSGKKMQQDSASIAMAYAGHQFGHFTMLGDGRAILLGEHSTPFDQKFDIQLKGAGRTPFSRGGDGRATLKAMLREYLISESMFALGIPSSRSLAVVKTGLLVNREMTQEGAVLTRVMSSHLRIGTFEYAQHYLTIDQQFSLLNYAVQRHFPELIKSVNLALDFLKAVQERQLHLIINWMRVGFIHGVMNTDNVHIGGETFDFGPCAFMNTYDTKTVFSSIDRHGRYSFDNQPDIALWNLSVLAGALLPLIDKNQETAIALVKEVLDQFAKRYQETWRKMMCNKIGLSSSEREDLIILDRLLTWMKDTKSDFSNTFLMISGNLDALEIQHDDTIKHWLSDLKKRILLKGTWKKALDLMHFNNPRIIPRNYWVEKSLEEATMNDNYALFNELLDAIKNQQIDSNSLKFTSFPPSHDLEYKTYCGT